MPQIKTIPPFLPPTSYHLPFLPPPPSAESREQFSTSSSTSYLKLLLLPVGAFFFSADSSIRRTQDTQQDKAAGRVRGGFRFPGLSFSAGKRYAWLRNQISSLTSLTADCYFPLSREDRVGVVLVVVTARKFILILRNWKYEIPNTYGRLSKQRSCCCQLQEAERYVDGVPQSSVRERAANYGEGDHEEHGRELEMSQG